MPNTLTYTEFFNRVKDSIDNGTFAKLTLAKTIGNPELQNIYVRTAVVENLLKLNVTFKTYKDGLHETEKIIGNLYGSTILRHHTIYSNSF